MVLDELQYFYDCSEIDLLQLSTDRFWNKANNMEIIKLRNRLQNIDNFRIVLTNDWKELNKLRFRLETLSKTQQEPDSLTDIKAKQKKLVGKVTELDEIRALLNRQRRERKKEQVKK